MANLAGRLVSGGLIVLVGLLLLLTTTGALPARSLWAWFPAVFVLLGAWALLRSGFRNLVGPAMVVAVAGTFLLRNLGYVSDEAIGTWWPLFVVLFGVLLVVGRSRRRRGAGIQVETGDEGDLVAIGVFGSGDRRVTGDRFTGGEVVSVFGGVDIDLRGATVDHPPAVLEVVAVFGGTEIRVPEGWSVELDVLALFGSADDERPSEPAGDEPDLVVTGVAIFGGVSVVD